MGTIKQNRANNIVTDGKIDATDGLNNNVPATNIANASLTNVTAYPPSAGAGVSQLASDPPSPTEGQMWYNTTTNTLKQYALGAGTWASGGNLNTARRDLGSSGESNSSSLAFGGSGYTAATESYNGTSWTEVNDLNTAKGYNAGAGTQTAAISAGGYSTTDLAETESWNGTSWTEVNDLNTARFALTVEGIQTSAIAAGGNTSTNSETWNGTSWTNNGTLNTNREVLAGAGADSTNALIFGGSAPPFVANTESWNGSSWTEVNDLNTARQSLGAAGTSNTASLAFGGGNPGNLAVTEEYNGTSWTEVADLSTARRNLGGDGTQDSALAFGGQTTASLAATEEWTKAVAIQTITAS